jgi:hypothetical protein
MTTRIRRILAGLPALLAAGAWLASPAAWAAETTGTFAGSKVNGGTATFRSEGGKRTLSLSTDFRVPETPDPHWQVVDSKGAVYLLHKLAIKGDRENRAIELPAYVPDVARVQIWCSFAETLLGEASFASPAR